MSAYTNVRRLEGKEVQYFDPNDPRVPFGKTAWRQEEGGAVECVLVMWGGVRAFVEKAKYIAARQTKVIEGKLISLGKPVRRSPPTRSRILRTTWWGSW